MATALETAIGRRVFTTAARAELVLEGHAQRTAKVYNFGSEAEGSRWVSFRALISDFVQFEAGDKPLMVAECASIEDPNDAERKAAWLDAAREALSDVPAIRALIYFHDPDSSLSVESSEPAFDAFRRLALDPVNSVSP